MRWMTLKSTEALEAQKEWKFRFVAMAEEALLGLEASSCAP
jgi:hypothetical protein